MRELSTIETERLKELTRNSISLTLIEPTATGLKKSILDATGPVRTYFLENRLHNYSIQKQGPEHKIQILTYLVEESSLGKSVASVYRPNTKDGDPRIWFKGLGGYSEANDIVAILVKEGTLYLVNLTKLDIQKLLQQKENNPLKELVSELRSKINEVSDELLFLLKKLAMKGPIPSLLNADTSVGRTLEQHLGIKINSSKTPDYKGIELKSYRDRIRGNRKNLFAQVPDWHLSKLKSSAEILDAFGYKRVDDFKLYCTVSAKNVNSQGLTLKVNYALNHLIENSKNPEYGDSVVWNLLKLHERLVEKHNETFWIAAESIKIDGKEHFAYTKVEHTQKPITSQFDILLEQGIITLDHLIKRASNGRVVEKGPLFKIKPNALELLFPPSKNYNLLK
ncbi:MAG: MvaI/BcnI family restriction endonuclease [Bacteroidota bacterium]|nr:MvaI/BcnI family restriction endonuclease [Bacteroidota bacterium]